MKIKIIILLSILLKGFAVYAEKFEVITKKGDVFVGDFVSKTDSTLTIREQKSKKYICFFGESIESAFSDQGGNYYFENGKLLGMSKTENDLNKWDEWEMKEKKRASNPNYVIGKAIKTAGEVSLGIGIPTLIAGSVTLGIGQAKINQYRKAVKILPQTNSNTKQLTETIANYEKKCYKYADCVTAGCVLMSVGGSLTLVGIPLVVHGNYIMDFSIQISENGAGLAVNF